MTGFPIPSEWDLQTEPAKEDHGFDCARWLHNDTGMKSIHIRSVPDEALLRLKRRAARHRRSLQQEIQVLLEDAARMVPPEAPTSGSLNLKIVRSGTSEDRFSRESFYDDDGR